MAPLDSIVLGPVLAACLAWAFQEAPAPGGGGSGAAEAAGGDPRASSSVPQGLRDELEFLENRMRIRETRVREAERFLDLERLILEENRRQRQIGAVAPRQIELLEVRVAEAESQLEARRAERDQVERMLEALRSRIESGSPESDVDQRRAALEGDLLASEIRLNAQEARLRAAELQIESEMASLENFMRAGRGGLTSPMALQQASYRIADARIWRDLMQAEREAAELLRNQLRRRLDAFNRGEWDGTPTLADLEARVRRLENEGQILRDEMYFLEDERRIIRSGRHERFGRSGPAEP